MAKNTTGELHTCPTSSTGKACNASHNAEMKQNKSLVKCRLHSAADKRNSLNGLNSRSMHLIGPTDGLHIIMSPIWTTSSFTRLVVSSFFIFDILSFPDSLTTSYTSMFKARRLLQVAIPSSSDGGTLLRWAIQSAHCQLLQWRNKNHRSPGNTVDCIVCPSKLTQVQNRLAFPTLVYRNVKLSWLPWHPDV